MATVDAFVEAVVGRKAVVGIIGLGYVGLPLALRLNEVGFKVLGFDIDPEKVELINAGQSYIKHIASEPLKAGRDAGLLEATADFARASEADALLVCVPTPLTHNREPDMQYVVATTEAIAPHLRRGQLVVLESTTYPGTTAEIMVPRLEKASGLKAGEDFFAAFSPEREDPANPSFKTSTIPKVVGGHTENCLRAAKALYDQIIERTVPVSSTQAAEATKLVENIFRSVNIAMVNELKLVFQRMGIDIWEVIEAAKTKPFGYMPFYPGPGLGGHCIPIDPFYLTWKAREYGINTRFIELAGEINTFMPEYVVQRTADALNDHGKPLKGSRILLLGLSYKADVDDMRESPTLRLIQLLEAKGAITDYHDPFIPAVKPNREHPELVGRASVDIGSAPEYDAVLISTAHSAIDYVAIEKNCKLVIDTRNAIKNRVPHVIRA